MQTWVNGALLADPEAAVLPVTDHGFTVGDGVFESVKVVGGEPFALTRHLDRLAGSARGLGLAEPSRADVRRAIDAVLSAEPLPLGRLRITWTAGPGPLGSGRSEGAGTLAVVAVPLEPRAETTVVVTVPWTRNERSAVAGLKTTSYAENVIALAEAQRRGATEAIFANTRGDLCEGTGSNVFYVVDGQLRTPTLGSGCLAGVTRALLLEWVGATEVDEPIETLGRADEVFLASTTRDVQAVRRCDDRELAAPGPMTREAMRTWAEREGDDLDP
ncbi:MAG TPA: aminotransferase class IV [Marmoricola sp.]|jgi:branched-chain amino acid aminotransferase|nr:aminotransferase class IV [Marmoricola sp.]